MQTGKPVYLDYYQDTHRNAAYIAENTARTERVLMRNPEEYTSFITSLARCDESIIVQTENSIYIVSGQIKRRPLVS
jgi:hypothetical protein